MGFMVKKPSLLTAGEEDGQRGKPRQAQYCRGLQ